MKKLLLFLMLAATSLLNAADSLNWLGSYPDALVAAKAEHKPVLVDFTGSDWCIWCVRLDKEIFSKPEFAAWAKDNAVLLKLDFPRNLPQSQTVKQANAELADKYKIQGFPTILILDETGKEKVRTGYKHLSAADYVKHLDSLLEKVIK